VKHINVTACLAADTRPPDSVAVGKVCQPTSKVLFNTQADALTIGYAA